MVDRGPCDVSQPGTDVSTRGRREVADRRGSTRSTPGPAAASRRARHARRLARRRTVGVLRGGSVRVTAQTRAHGLFRQRPEARELRPITKRHAYIRRLHTLDYKSYQLLDQSIEEGELETS